MKRKYGEELRYSQSAVQECKDYLLSPLLFWNLGVDPQFTLGNLLLSIRILKVLANSADQKEEVEQLVNQLHSLRKKWSASWEKKANEEHTFRVRQWGIYILDLSSSFEAQWPFYATQVRNRVLLALLGEDSKNQPPEEIALVAIHDNKLRTLLKNGDFVWDQELMDVFPREKYWYLWGQGKI